MVKMLAAVSHKGNKQGGDIKLEEVEYPNISGDKSLWNLRY